MPVEYGVPGSGLSKYIKGGTRTIFDFSVIFGSFTLLVLLHVFYQVYQKKASEGSAGTTPAIWISIRSGRA